MPCGCGSNRSCHRASPDRNAGASISGSLAVGANPSLRARFSRPLFMCCAPVVSGRRCPRASAAPAPFTIIFSSGGRRDSLCGCGARGWQNTTTWRGLLGNGKAWTGRKAKLPWRRRRWATTRPTGGKKGTKRSLLVDGRGAPLSLIVAGANRHDVKLLAQTLDAIVVPRPKPTKRRPQNLYVDKGYAGKPADQQMRARGYIPHVPKKGGPQARHKTKGRARRWVVERTHSWMNNYRKLRVRYEKKAANFEALLHLAIAIICWRM
jgi:transposase